MKDRRLFLILIIGLALALRLFKLGNIPVSMYVDEAAIGVDAQSIAQTGKDMHGGSWLSAMFPSYGDYKLPVYIWFTALSVRMFGATEFAVRLPSALAGVLTVLLAYGITYELFEKHSQKGDIALSSALMTAILPWSVIFSRVGFEGHLGQALLAAGVYMALLGRKYRFAFLVSGTLGALAVYTYFSVRFVFPVVYLTVVFLFGETRQWKALVLPACAGLLLFIALLFPLFSSPYYKPSTRFRLSASSILDNTQRVVQTNMLRGEDGNTLLSRVIHHRYLYFTEDLLKNYAEHLDFSYLFLTGDANLRHGTEKIGLMYLSTLPFFLAGIYGLIRRYRKVGVFLALWYGLALLPASVPLEVPHALRSLNGVAVLGIVLGYGFWESAVWLRKKKRSGTLLILLAALLVEVMLFAHDYLIHYPGRSAKAWSDGRKQATELVREKKDSVDSVLVMGDDRMFLWVLFYGKYDFRDVQRVPSVQYVKKSIGNVFFLDGLNRDMMKKSNRTLLVGIEDQLKGFSPKRIVGAAGDSLYMYAFVPEDTTR